MIIFLLCLIINIIILCMMLPLYYEYVVHSLIMPRSCKTVRVINIMDILCLFFLINLKNLKTILRWCNKMSWLLMIRLWWLRRDVGMRNIESNGMLKVIGTHDSFTRLLKLSMLLRSYHLLLLVIYSFLIYSSPINPQYHSQW